jgi:hypothetical protein
MLNVISKVFTQIFELPGIRLVRRIAYTGIKI